MQIITHLDTGRLKKMNNSCEFSAFHAGNRGSNPRGDANLQMVKSLRKSIRRLFLSVFPLLWGLWIPFVAEAADPWTDGDLGREIFWQGLHLIDWGQTVKIARHPEDYYESNPFLGRHPEERRVHQWMISGAALHPIVTHILPRKVSVWGYKIPLREPWQYVTIGMSLGCVVNNFSIGLGFGWQ